MLLQIFVVFQDVAVWCIVVQCDAAVLQYVAVRCSRAFLHILVQLLIYVGDVCVCVCVCVCMADGRAKFVYVARRV